MVLDDFSQPLNTEHEQAVEIIVSDDGCGIEAACLDHIFEPFFTTKAGTGTGLGLWVAKEIVERHQGSIETHRMNHQADSGGATFIVRLPAGPGDRSSKPQISSRKPVSTSARDFSEIFGAEKLG